MLIDVKQAAEYLSVHRDTVISEVHAGRLIGFKIASVWRFDTRDLDFYIDERRKEAVTRNRVANELKNKKVSKLKPMRTGALSQGVIEPIWIPGMKIQDVVARNAAAGKG